MLKPSAVTILLFLCNYVSACATKLEYQSPTQINLSGEWILNKGLSQEVVLPRPERGATRSRTTKSAGGERNSGRSRGEKPSRNDESGSLINQHKSRPSKPDAMTSIEMTIDQSDDSMGVRYHNDNYRDVAWGKIKYRGVTTAAGWDEQTLRIITNGQRLSFSESYHLDSTLKVLTVTFNVAGKEFSRIYNKKSHQESKGFSGD